MSIPSSDSASEPRILLTDGVADDARIEFPTHSSRDNVWITLQRSNGRPKAVLNIVVTEEGIVLDLYQEQDEDAEEADMAPIASTYAFDQDITSAKERT